MRGDQKPSTPQWIVSAVRDIVQNLFRHVDDGLPVKEGKEGENLHQN